MTDVAMDDMEVDLDLDVDPEIARLNAEAEAIRANNATSEAMNGVEEAPEEGEVDSNAPAPTKVHIRGLDNLTTSDVRQYAGEHYDADVLGKIEWVDDTSANLVYDTEIFAAEALLALSAEELAEPLQLRPAKKLSTRPDVELSVRQAIMADVKAPNAKAQSRFYLFNPQYDPDNRPRKRRYQDDGYTSNKYRRREYDDERHHRRGSRESPSWHEDMYDEKPKAAPARRRESYQSDGELGRKKVNYENGRELLPNRAAGRLARDRSASPPRGPRADGDGRYGFAEQHPRRITPRARSRTPSGIRAGRDNRAARDNIRKELFADRKPASALANGNTNHERPPTPSKAAIELFPDKATHRRQDAKDLHPNEVADAIGKYTIDDDQTHYTYDRSGRRPEMSNGRPRDLFERIDGGAKGTLLGERNGGSDFSFRGASDSESFSIRGASRRDPHPLTKELFPKGGSGVAGAAGGGRLNGGMSRRNRAEDLFG